MFVGTGAESVGAFLTALGLGIMVAAAIGGKHGLRWGAWFVMWSVITKPQPWYVDLPAMLCLFYFCEFVYLRLTRPKQAEA